MAGALGALAAALLLVGCGAAALACGRLVAPADWGVVALVAADGYVDVNGPGAAVRTAPTHPSFADPAEVTGEHCFEDYKAPTSYAYVQLQPDGTLAAAFGDGPCPAALPADHAVYYR